MPQHVHLHSSLPAEQIHGWDLRSSGPLLTLSCDSRSLLSTLTQQGKMVERWTDPLAALQWMARHIIGATAQRWVGYLSYDLGRFFERLPVLAADDLQLPLFCFSLHAGDGQAPEPPPPCRDPIPSATFNSSVFSSLHKPQYLARIAKIIEYISAGDIFQVNLSQRFTADLTLSPGQIWRNLMALSPAAYGAFLDCGDHAIISNSPELFLRVDPDRRVITRPIKGTRPNQPGMRQQLESSVKDQAELNMIIDLERNDLGRVCQIGSVRVTQPRTVEAHPTVYHGVATIEGLLRDDVTFADLLRATFPGGSITGAPKIRAMQIIEELEPVRRGPYCGAIGYLAGDGTMQFNVAIRTMIVKENKVHIPAGGGIVADSDARDEYEETLVKARAMFAALSIAPPQGEVEPQTDTDKGENPDAK